MYIPDPCVCLVLNMARERSADSQPHSNFISLECALYIPAALRAAHKITALAVAMPMPMQFLLLTSMLSSRHPMASGHLHQADCKVTAKKCVTTPGARREAKHQHRPLQDLQALRMQNSPLALAFPNGHTVLDLDQKTYYPAHPNPTTPHPGPQQRC